MTPAEADWVYDVVLTRRYKESTGAIMWTGARETRSDEGQGAAMLRLCACRYGPCGRCSDGRPDLCAQRRGWRSGPSPETHVVSPAGYALTEVWMSGRACRWRCSGPNLRATVQLDLFALAGGARGH